MNIIDLFIKRRNKVKRLTRKLIEARKREDYIRIFVSGRWRNYTRYGLEDAIHRRDEQIIDLKKKLSEIEDKYTMLKAIVLSIDDEK